MHAAGVVSAGAYLPAKSISSGQALRLSAFLQDHTRVPRVFARYVATEKRLPGTVETNEEGWMSKPWFEAWVQTLPPGKQKDPFLGTKERRRVPPDPDSLRQSIHPHPMLSTHAEAIAAAIAIVNGPVSPEDIDLVLGYSQIPDQLPSTASALQDCLKLRGAGAYGVDTCCSTFVTMIDLASSLVRSGQCNHVLCACSHIASHVHDPSEYCCVRLGDGAVAAVVSAVPEGQGYVASHATSDGSVHDAVQMVRRRPSLLRRTAMGPTYEQNLVTFANKDACKVIASTSNERMRGMARALLERGRCSVEDLDFFVTHQPVEWAGRAWCDALGIDENRFYESFERYGNIGCASVGANFCEALEQGRIGAGDLVLLASSGAGENHVGVLERVSPALVEAMRA
jgi:3-oxoacyl-[acyl-carrier-protein] synthase-3